MQVHIISIILREASEFFSASLAYFALKESPVLLRCFPHPGQSMVSTLAAQRCGSAMKMRDQRQWGQCWNLCYAFPTSARLKPANAPLPGPHLSWGLWRTFCNTGSISSRWYFCLSLRRDAPGKGSACGWCMCCLHCLSGRKEWKIRSCLGSRAVVGLRRNLEAGPQSLWKGSIF